MENNGFMPFLEALASSETQIPSCRVRTMVTVFISLEDNRLAKNGLIFIYSYIRNKFISYISLRLGTSGGVMVSKLD